MKARLTFALISIAIVALLGICAWFTMKIFDTQVPEFSAKPRLAQPADKLSVTHEEQITVPEDSLPTDSGAVSDIKVPAASTKTSPDLEPGTDYAGVVLQVVGKAYRVKESGVRVPLTINDKIMKDDHIQTDAESRLTIVFLDKTNLSLGENTRCSIDEYTFDKTSRNPSGFGLRLMEGVCRVVTGLITTLNPERFRVETRMATIGIRGCELAFTAKHEEEKVFILGLSEKEAVVVSSADKGQPIRDILTGMEDDNVSLSSTVVTEQGTVITVSKGLGRSSRAISPAELRQITTDTTPLNSVKHTPSVRSDRTVFVISPGKHQGGDQNQ